MEAWQSTGASVMSICAICTTMAFTPPFLSGAELEVKQSENQGGVYHVRTTEGRWLGFQIHQRGPSEAEISENESRRETSDQPHSGYELIVSLEPKRGLKDEEIIPLQSPVDVTDIKVIEDGSKVLLAIVCKHTRDHWRGAVIETRWIVVQIDPEVRFLRNSMLETRDLSPCSPGDFASAQASIKPGWEFRGGELWFEVPVRSWVCWNGGETRGSFEWQVNHRPARHDVENLDGLAVLAARAREIGYQPYAATVVVQGLKALMAESPTNHGASRFLGLNDRSRAEGAILLPQFGFQGGSSWWVRNNVENHPRGKFGFWVDHYRKEWPEVAEVETFRWSEEMLLARASATGSVLWKKGEVRVVEFSLPCIEHSYPQPNGNDRERWLIRTEPIGANLGIEAALLEPCADQPLFGGAGPVSFPEAEVLVAADSVTIRYGDPVFDIGSWAREKFLFDWLRSTWDLFSDGELVFGEAPTVRIARTRAPVPTSGSGWRFLRYAHCDLEIRFNAGTSLRSGSAEKTGSPRPILTPESFPWCENPTGITTAVSMQAVISSTGRVYGIKRGYGGEMSSGLALPELQAFFEEWEFDPARDQEGNPIEGILSAHLNPRRAVPKPRE